MSRFIVRNKVDVEVVEVFNSANGSTGSEITPTDRQQLLPAHLHAEVGSGDTLTVEGRVSGSLSYIVLLTITASNIYQFNPPASYRIVRTSGSGTSRVSVKYFGNTI